MMHAPCPHCLETTATEDLHTLDSGESVCPDCATTTIYCARWCMNGESRYAQADTQAALDALVFGQVYAPNRNQVIFTQYQKESE